MLIKYIDPNTNCTVIQSFSSVTMEKTEDSEDHKYELTFLCDTIYFCVVSVFCDSYSLVNEYLNKIYDFEKIDFSHDANIKINVENTYNDESIKDFLFDLGIDNDDLDDEDYMNFLNQ